MRKAGTVLYSHTACGTQLGSGWSHTGSLCLAEAERLSHSGRSEGWPLSPTSNAQCPVLLDRWSQLL